MSQDYQSIGQLAPEADAIAQERKGWQGHDGEDLIVQRTDHDFSFWNARANRQEIGLQYPESMPAHTETPAAEIAVEPFSRP